MADFSGGCLFYAISPKLFTLDTEKIFCIFFRPSVTTLGIDYILLQKLYENIIA